MPCLQKVVIWHPGCRPFYYLFQWLANFSGATKYAERYLAEAMYRFNRRFQMAAMMPRLLVAAARCPPWPERQVRDVPVFAC